jgi:flagellar hook assembly protein FlgD
MGTLTGFRCCGERADAGLRCQAYQYTKAGRRLQEVSLRVFNTAGQLVRTLAQGPTKPGAYATVWNGTDHKGRRLAAGVYFYTLETGDKRLSRKVVLTE